MEAGGSGDGGGGGDRGERKKGLNCLNGSQAVRKWLLTRNKYTNKYPTTTPRVIRHASAVGPSGRLLDGGVLTSSEHHYTQSDPIEQQAIVPPLGRVTLRTMASIHFNHFRSKKVRVLACRRSQRGVGLAQAVERVDF